MTTPKVATLTRSGSRFYVEPTTGEKVPGVTSVLNAVPKPFLQYWGQKLVAEYAYDNVAAIVNLAVSGEREAAVDMLKNAPRRFTQGRASIGTDAHGIFESMARGEKARVTPETKGHAEQFQMFLDEFQPEFLMMEETCWSDTHRYAGSFDAICQIGGETVILDYKTSKSAYPDTALQLAAYRHADHIVRADGNKVPIPTITGGAVLHIREDEHTLYPYECGQEVFDTFLALRHHVYEWLQEQSKTVKGRPLAPLFK